MRAAEAFQEIATWAEKLAEEFGAEKRREIQRGNWDDANEASVSELTMKKVQQHCLERVLAERRADDRLFVEAGRRDR